ncbi:MAG TPA: PEGA domain-containing protein, partial [Vicinamibacteria bacterium]|nr:PEGA domain-containing protein [Vicinamibacteria bacterium]
MTARGALAVLLPSFLFVASAPSAGAQEWHEAYRDGLKALAQNQPARAVGLLEYAVSQRPQPGRDVVTYGTNVERQYYPYLKLAEAYLRLHDLAGVRSALKRSETWAREPAEERRRLAAQLDALVAAAATPAPAVPSPAATAPPAAAGVEPPPSPLPVFAVKPETPPATAGVRAEHPSEPRPAPSGPRREGAAANATAPVPGAAPATGSPSTAVLEIVSQPPGASVYVDDELIGATDPEWGRLVRSGLAAGRHRVRLSLAGYADLTEEVDLAAAGRGELRRRLVPATASRVDRRRLVFGGVAVLLLAL